MADFKPAVLRTLANEGGYVNDPADPGGATNYGITQKDMPGQDIRDLTIDQAVSYYSEHYWKPLYSQIEDQMVADKLFDMGVLFGVGEAVEILQLALKVDNDGDFGPVTLKETNGAEPSSLVGGYKALLVQHASGIGALKPTLRKFVAGWIRRINS